MNAEQQAEAVLHREQGKDERRKRSLIGWFLQVGSRHIPYPRCFLKQQAQPFALASYDENDFTGVESATGTVESSQHIDDRERVPSQDQHAQLPGSRIGNGNQLGHQHNLVDQRQRDGDGVLSCQSGHDIQGVAFSIDPIELLQRYTNVLHAFLQAQHFLAEGQKLVNGSVGPWTSTEQALHERAEFFGVDGLGECTIDADFSRFTSPFVRPARGN